MFAILPVRLMVRVSSNAMKHNNKKKHGAVLNSKMSLNRDDERIYCNSHSENIIGVDEAGKSILIHILCIYVHVTLTGMQDEDR